MNSQGQVPENDDARACTPTLSQAAPPFFYVLPATNNKKDDPVSAPLFDPRLISIRTPILRLSLIHI